MIEEELLKGNNIPPKGRAVFDSSDHVRFQNGQDVSGHNFNCHRRFVIEKNIEGDEGYTVTLYNLDGVHPLWQNNIQMAPKKMKIIKIHDNVVEMQGYGYDKNALAIGVPIQAASFSNYGLFVMFDQENISSVQLNMFDRNVSIVYLK